MERLRITTLLLLVVHCLYAQFADPVHFKSELLPTKGAEGEIVFTASIDPGWHVYSTNLGNDGPIEATFTIVQADGVEPVGKLTAKGQVIKKFDPMFGMELKYFEGTAQFVQKVRFTKPEYAIDCFLEYGACNDESCLPPTQVELKKKGKSPVADTPEKADVPTPTTGTADTLRPTADALPPLPGDTDTVATVVPDLWRPVTDELRAADSTGNSLADSSLLYILLMGFVGGLLAVAMPCIWPVIPMTVSFFLKRSKTDRRRGVRDAILYGLSIIVIYLGLGLLVTAVFGSDALNAMSTNAVFNVLLFLLLVVFALSFFGWFEIKLPDSWANKVDEKAEALESTSGSPQGLQFNTVLSIFLMAFTLVLVSFSCTAPIIGLLLVETATSGNWTAPAVGMLGFAVALALPFTLFALFPSWLRQAPKSGAWMNTLKVTLGFIELAFALKFLSVADLAYGWRLLDREVFLSLWIAIFGLLGAYLCGWLKFQSDEAATPTPQRPSPVICIMGGLVSLVFAIYMVPGLWGAPCKAISAFAPPMNTQDFNLNTQTVEAQFTDYDAGMAAARSQGKPVFLDFTGFGCVNCRKMEAAVWTDPRVAERLRRDFVLISLYVDDKTPLPEPVDVTDAKGNKRTLRTVGAKWSFLQSHKFGANAQPFYVMLDPATGRPLAGSRAYDEDISKFLEFLEKGLVTMRNNNEE